MINKHDNERSIINERGDTRMAKTKPIPAGPVRITSASLSKLSKVKLEEFALATYGVDIDRRKRKDELVKEVLKLSKKKAVVKDVPTEAKLSTVEKLAKEAEQTIADIAGITPIRNESVTKEQEPKKGFWSRFFGW